MYIRTDVYTEKNCTGPSYSGVVSTNTHDFSVKTKYTNIEKGLRLESLFIRTDWFKVRVPFY